MAGSETGNRQVVGVTNSSSSQALEETLLTGECRSVGKLIVVRLVA